MLETTAETIDTLKELQTLDTQLRGTRNSVEALSLRVDDHRKHVRSLETEVEDQTQKLKDQGKRVGMKELELKGIQEKTNKLRQQLNVTSSNREYQTMLREIGEFEADGSRCEDNVLALLDAVDETKADMARLQEEIASAREAVKAEEASVAEDVGELNGNIQELEARRRDLAGRLDGGVLDKYERILNSRSGLAVVAVIGGVCQGCNMGVTKQMISRLWSKKELLFCNNCSRLMYLEGEVT